MSFRWEQAKRRRGHPSPRPTPYNPNETMGDVLFRHEWPDGLVLGVVDLDGTLYYVRYDRTMRRWTFRMQGWQIARIRAEWDNQNPDQGESDADGA